MTGTTKIDPAKVTDDDIQDILDLYGSPMRTLILNFFERLYGGMANTSFKVSAKNHEPKEMYVLTFLDGHTKESADRLVELLFALGGNVGVCPPPVTTATGKAIVQWRGHNIMLRPYVSGVAREATTVELETLGAAIASVHLTSVKTPVIDVESQRRIHDRWMLNSWNVDPEAAKVIAAAKRSSEPTSFGSWPEIPHGNVHGDLLPQNIVWSHNTDEAIPTIIDWDTACADALILDLAIAIVGHCRSTGKYARYPLSHERFAALVGGYQSVRLLETTENSILHHVIDFAAAMIAASRISMRVTKAGRDGLPTYKEYLDICDSSFDTGTFVDNAWPEAFSAAVLDWNPS